MAEDKNTKDLQAKVAELEKLRDEYQAKLAEVEKENSELKSHKQSAEELITELNKAVAEKDANQKNPLMELTHKGEKYFIRVPKFTTTVDGKGKVITAEELKNDKELVAKLVKENSGVLVKKGGE